MKNVLLKSVCSVTMGQAPPGTSYNDNDEGLPLIAGAGDFGDTTPNPSRFTTKGSKVSSINDIILCIRASIGGTNWSDKTYCLGRGVAGLHAMDEKLDRCYLWYWLGTMKRSLMRQARGSTFKQVNKETIENMQIPLPPLEKQKRIAAILDKADAIRRKRQESIRLTEEFLKSVFLDMFGDPVTNPKGWPTEALSDVVSHAKHSLKRGPFGGSLKKEIFVSNGYKVYEQKHAIQNNFSIGTYYINEQKFHDMRSFEIRPGNLIISCSGTVGRIAIVPESIQPGIINQALLKISPDHEKISSLFLKYLLETESVQRELFGFSRGSGIKNFPPMSEVKKLQILLPNRNVITEFHHLHRIHYVFLSKYNLSLGLTDNLFNTLVQSSFKGNPK